MQDAKKLVVFRRSDALAERVYRVTASFPRWERFGLTGQLQRSAVSVPANIIEGANRASGRDFARHLSIALGSAAEAAYLLDLARRLEYLDPRTAGELEHEYQEVLRMLNALYVRVMQSAVDWPASSAGAE